MMINLLQISSFITLFKCYQITLPLIVFWTDDVNKAYTELHRSSALLTIRPISV